MANALTLAALIAWLLALLSAFTGRFIPVARLLLALGCLAIIVVAFATLPGSTPDFTLYGGPEPVVFALHPMALWLLGFGAAAALPACLLGSPSKSRRGWVACAAFSLIGALGVFGLQNGIAFLVAWEVMSLGGAVMILGERLGRPGGRRVLLMLGLLEVGSVALVAAFLILGSVSMSFTQFAATSALFPPAIQGLAGVLIIVGFGAKLGLLPFYEWFPAAYGVGSGASGNLLSGIVLNAAIFGLCRGMVDWLGASPAAFGLSIVLVIVGVLSAILSVMFAFQEDDWRGLLSFSTAENAGIAVTTLGASMLFASQGHLELAGLAWMVVMLHMAGHALAKGSLFMAADGVFGASGSYAIAQRGILKHSPWILGVGAVFGGMSLAAMPPQAGFVSEWYVFQTMFQGFHLDGMTGRLVLALAGAGLALTAAIAFATFIKVLGIGLQGQGKWEGRAVGIAPSLATLVLGLAVLVLAVAMPWLMQALDDAVYRRFALHAAQSMRVGWILVPLTNTFAFISPTTLVIVCPLLALFPIGILVLRRRFPLRRAPVWYGGLPRDSERIATTSLTFANAMRTFYSFIYRPRLDVAHEHAAHGTFLRRLQFEHQVRPLFEPWIFVPLVQITRSVAQRLRALQSGHLNFYLALIGFLLVLILAVAVI